MKTLRYQSKDKELRIVQVHVDRVEQLGSKMIKISFHE